jgi:Lar family restriction alleviation protein
MKLAPHIQKIRDGYGAKFDGRRRKMEKLYLKPCPFCGKSEAVLAEGAFVAEGEEGDDLFVQKWVECQNCGALGPPTDRREEAAKSWNERKNGKPELIRVVNHDHDLTGEGK